MADQLDLLGTFFGVEQRTVGCLVTTNHNKAAVRGLISQPVTAYVGHVCWQLAVASLAAASGDAVVIPMHVDHHPPIDSPQSTQAVTTCVRQTDR